MKNNPKTKAAVMSAMLVLTGIICVAVLFNVQVYTAYAIWKTPVITEKHETLLSFRGEIFDRNGNILAGTDKSGKRYYPQKNATHVLGALNSSGEPQSGIELAYNDELSGADGEIISQYTTYKGETYLSNRTVLSAQNGSDIYLTLDINMQKTAEDILKTAIKTSKSGNTTGDTIPPSGTGGAITVLNCNTGEVLAMASAPDYTLENFSDNYDKICKQTNSPLLNRATQGLYRPGSTLKTITAFAALSENAIYPQTYYQCSGKYYCEGTAFSCMKEHKITNVTKALELSCNIFFYKTSQELGIEKLLKYEALFGLSQDSAFELPTYDGQLASPQLFTEVGERWSTQQLIQAAIGQSKTLCTPLQMATLSQTIATRGTRYTPTIISYIEDYTSTVTYRSKPVVVKKIDDPKNAFETCIDGMKASTAYTYGEFSLSALPEKAATKTGTPQSPRGYDSAIIGFYPAENPQIAYSVMLEGGENAKNSSHSIIQSYLDSQ